jgi:hypothetical protein
MIRCLLPIFEHDQVAPAMYGKRLGHGGKDARLGHPLPYLDRRSCADC